MSKARGLISGGNHESRSSGMYDSADNIRIAAISTAGLKKIGIRYKTVMTTGMTYPYSFTWSPDGLHLYLAYSGDYIRHIECTTPFSVSGSSIQETFDHREYDSSNYSLEVSPDGKYLYFGGTGRDTILQFTMNTPWDITNLPNNTTFSAGYDQINKRLNKKVASKQTTTPKTKTSITPKTTSTKLRLQNHSCKITIANPRKRRTSEAPNQSATAALLLSIFP